LTLIAICKTSFSFAPRSRLWGHNHMIPH